MTELKPCPFCGSRSWVLIVGAYSCAKCNYCLPLETDMMEESE